MVLIPAGQLQSQLYSFKAGYSFYTIIYIRYEILHWQFIVKNLETKVYMMSFLIKSSQLFEQSRHRLTTLEGGQYCVSVRPASFGIDE